MGDIVTPSLVILSFSLQAAVSSVVERGVVDGGHVCVIGGSHGGSIAAHLIGQYPVGPVSDYTYCHRVRDG